MADQAQKLRDLVSDEPARDRPQTSRSRARVVSVTSGKGGVGKTNIAVALAIALTALKKKVALVDFDLGLANANVLLRTRHRWNLSHYLGGKRSLVDVVTLGPGGLLFLPGANGLAKLADINAFQRQKLLKGLKDLERRVDYVIVDTGAGLSKNVMTFAAAADDVVVVTTPEPTAVLDAYSVLRQLAVNEDRGALHLLVNQVPSRREAVSTADRLCQASEQFLDLHVEKLGYVLSDPQVPLSVSARRSFILDNPRSPASTCIESVARHFADIPETATSRSRGFFERLVDGFIGKKSPVARLAS